MLMKLEQEPLPQWLCMVNILAFDEKRNQSYWNCYYCSIPSRSKEELKGFRNEWLRVITVADWHPVDYCPIAEKNVFEEPGRCPDTSGKAY